MAGHRHHIWDVGSRLCIPFLMEAPLYAEITIALRVKTTGGMYINYRVICGW